MSFKERDLIDLILNQFGLTEVWPIIMGTDTNLAGLFTTGLVRLLTASAQTINEARPIFAQLTNELTSGSVDVVAAITQALNSLNAILLNSGF
jgi:hypothetical protein